MDLRWLILGLRKLSFGPERTDFRPERAIKGSERVNLELRKGLRRGMYVRTDGRISGNSPVLQDIGPLGRCPKRIKGKGKMKNERKKSMKMT